MSIYLGESGVPSACKVIGQKSDMESYEDLQPIGRNINPYYKSWVKTLVFLPVHCNKLKVLEVSFQVHLPWTSNIQNSRVLIEHSKTYN